MATLSVVIRHGAPVSPRRKAAPAPEKPPKEEASATPRVASCVSFLVPALGSGCGGEGVKWVRKGGRKWGFQFRLWRRCMQKEGFLCAGKEKWNLKAGRGVGRIPSASVLLWLAVLVWVPLCRAEEVL